VRTQGKLLRRSGQIDIASKPVAFHQMVRPGLPKPNHGPRIVSRPGRVRILERGAGTVTRQDDASIYGLDLIVVMDPESHASKTRSTGRVERCIDLPDAGRLLACPVDPGIRRIAGR